MGEPGMGFKIAMTTLDSGRIGIAAQALGINKIENEHGTQIKINIVNNLHINDKLHDIGTEIYLFINFSN